MSVPEVREPSLLARAFGGLPPLLQAILLILAVATGTAVLAAGAMLAWFEWEDYQFQHGPYCKEEPTDPLCG